MSFFQKRVASALATKILHTDRSKDEISSWHSRRSSVNEKILIDAPDRKVKHLALEPGQLVAEALDCD